MTRSLLLVPPLALLGAFVLPPAAAANPASIGPHFGFNFDVEDPFLGVEGRVDLGRVGSSVMLQLNPSFSYYFTDNVDMLNLSINVPFEFRVGDSGLRPFVAPGLGVWYFDYNVGSDTELTFNLLGGLLFELDAVEPYFQLRVALGDGSMAELMGGLLIVL